MEIGDWGLGEGDDCGQEAWEWVELRDGAGKLQGKWDPAARVLELQRRGGKDAVLVGWSWAKTCLTDGGIERQRTGYGCVKKRV